MGSRAITCSCKAYLCRITLYVLFRRYITAVLFSAYSRSGSVLPCVLRCEITAVITAYTLLTTLEAGKSFSIFVEPLAKHRIH